MTDIAGKPGELRMAIEIVRAETGCTETIELIGRIDAEHDEEDSE